MWLPKDWEAERGPGWWSLHHLIHKPCGWVSHNAYDLVISGGPFDVAAAREVVYSHQCNPDD